MEKSLAKLISVEQWNQKQLNGINNISFLHRGKFVRTSLDREKIDIDTLPIADRTLCKLNEYIDVRSILSSRGCVMKCSYCHVPDFWSSRKGRSPEYIIQEIQMLIKDF
jgi:radical SAM superfamily enzyme YgiQ (UPF0313 family)